MADIQANDDGMVPAMARPRDRHVALGNEEENNQEVDEGPMAALGAPGGRILGIQDPGRMELSSEERGWALTIKDVAKGTPGLDTLSDFMCAQLAIIHRENAIAAVEVAVRMQQVREEYQIADTLEDGIVKVQRLANICPGALLSFSFNQETGCYTLVVDVPKMDMTTMRHLDNIKASIAAAHYHCHCLTPDFEAIRRGALYIVECQGYSWGATIQWHLQYSERYWADCGELYPFKIRQIRCFHTPMFFNIIKSMGRRFISDETYSKIKVGCSFSGRLDSIYLVPSFEAAEQRLLARLKAALNLRYENQRSFSL